MKALPTVFWAAVMAVSFFAVFVAADQFFGAGWQLQVGPLIIVSGILAIWLFLLMRISYTVLKIVATLLAWTILAFIICFSVYLFYFVFFRFPILRDVVITIGLIFLFSGLGGVVAQERKRALYHKMAE